MNARFELSARAALALAGADESVVQKVAREMDPYVAAEADGAHADVVLEAARERGRPPLTELMNPAGDALVTAFDGSNHYLLDGSHACLLPHLGVERPFRLVYDRGFPISRMFRSVVRPALQIAALDHGAATVHASAVELVGNALLVAGWSESGKTETALAFVEQGARFLSGQVDSRRGRRLDRHVPDLRRRAPVASSISAAPASRASATDPRPVCGRDHRRGRLPPVPRATASRNGGRGRNRGDRTGARARRPRCPHAVRGSRRVRRRG